MRTGRGEADQEIYVPAGPGPRKRSGAERGEGFGVNRRTVAVASHCHMKPTAGKPGNPPLTFDFLLSLRDVIMISLFATKKKSKKKI